MRYRPSAIAVVVGLILGAVLSTAGPADATRNSTGQYSLPAGNPVVSGTTISSSWANNTLADLSVEMTNSLDRQGRGGMLAPLKLSNGSASQPSISWTSDPDSGLYRAGANDVRMQVDGVQSQQWTSTGTTATGTFTAATTSTFTGAATFNSAATFQSTVAVTGATTLNSTATIGGNTSVAGVLSAAAGGPALALKPGTADHVYQEFYARTATPATRSGYLGYATAATSEFTITNSVPTGDMRFVTPGVIRADSNVVLSAANPPAATAFSNTLTKKNIAKAWARVVAAGSGSTVATVEEGFNVSGASVSGDTMTITFASPFVSGPYVIVATPSTRRVACGAEVASPTTAIIQCTSIDSASVPLPPFNFQATSLPGFARMHIAVFGAQ